MSAKFCDERASLNNYNDRWSLDIVCLCSVRVETLECFRAYDVRTREPLAFRACTLELVRRKVAVLSGLHDWKCYYLGIESVRSENENEDEYEFASLLILCMHSCP